MQKASNRIRVGQIRPENFENFPIWRFCGSDSDGEPMVAPLKSSRVRSLRSRVLGSQAMFANGELHWAILANFDIEREKVTEHFVILSVWTGTNWFHLARYFDPWFDTHGPPCFAQAIDKPIDDIFPIRYDISEHVPKSCRHASGEIQKSHPSPISNEERMDLLFAHLQPRT
jgi:hypothetical protein